MHANPDDEIVGGELRDFTEPGMHITWLVHDPEAFLVSPGPTSERDRLLHFGLTYQEWKNLYFDVLAVHQTGRAKVRKESDSRNIVISEFDESEPRLKEYPMLSRIRGILHDAVFEVDEVEPLRQECIRVKTLTTDKVALRGLDKLLLICRWAKKLDLNIYLMAD